MSKGIPKIKGIRDNSLIKAIGNIYRPIDGKDWKINIQLEPEQGKQSLKISQLPLLARRRMLNATEPPVLGGYKLECVMANDLWEAVRIGDCPLAGMSQRQDREQWCFRFEHEGTKFYLPQLELARALFLYEPYLCRMAMHPGSLTEEFDIQVLDQPNEIQINLLPSCTLPKFVRGDHELRRALASVILDPDIRRSFESISKFQMEDGENIGRYRVWPFRFTPPPLNSVRLGVRGQFDKKTSTMFVFEIYGLEGLQTNHPGKVHFYDPEFARSISRGKGTATEATAFGQEDFEIDDDELPEASGAQELVLDSPKVVRTYQNPAHTSRNGKDKKRSSGGKKEDASDEEPVDIITDVSTDEGSRIGQLQAAGIDGMDDQSDDAKNYAGRFQAFDAMVKALESNGCKKTSSQIRKLPELKGRSKYLLADGNPRCWSIQTLSSGNSRFTLMEVDTQGNASRLSTLLVRHPQEAFDWPEIYDQLAKRIVKESLKWPTKYLDSLFPNDEVQRIIHPTSSPENKDLLDSGSIAKWAARVLSKIQ